MVGWDVGRRKYDTTGMTWYVSNEDSTGTCTTPTFAYVKRTSIILSPQPIVYSTRNREETKEERRRRLIKEHNEEMKAEIKARGVLMKSRHRKPFIGVKTKTERRLLKIRRLHNL